MSRFDAFALQALGAVVLVGLAYLVVCAAISGVLRHARRRRRASARRRAFGAGLLSVNELRALEEHGDE